MFYIKDEFQTMNGIPTREALKLKKEGKEIFNRKGKEATVEEIENFINSNRKSVYDLMEQ